ncbi:APC family permease [Histidinibacterium lentulum]|uniref:Amino acid permease n=1 Tax=Histidinibacterium lentulum TaxID=2480588 RepID=A0A3N2R0Q7_9RHOB|nr:amino acid permease [Histidinibacterium lentulum]ROU01060.1 amino acid permease [Histidinibacterium lentulum]
MSETTDQRPGSGLERSMGFWGLTFYGSGTILGAGIFVVIGEVIAEAGRLSPVAYAVAGLVAIFTALSYAEIAARIPTAGGPIDYVQKAFHSRRAGSATGWVLTVANIVSGATITTGFVSYVNSFAEVPDWMATTGLIVLLGVVAIAGMKHTAWFMTVTTIIGVATLLLILWIARDGLLSSPSAIASAATDMETGAISGVFAAAFLAIYSFIGFGDMTQTAEEVRDVRRTLPAAMIASLVVVFFFYIGISAAVTGSGDVEEIATAEAPLVAAVERQGWPGLPFAIASLFVIVNGGLTQIVAASRLLLDLGRDGRGAPGLLARVNRTTATPIPATLLTLGIVLALALFFPLKNLAAATSLSILVVFFLVNLALWRLKRESQPEGVPDMWKAVPLLGAAFCAGAIGWQIVSWL